MTRAKTKRPPDDDGADDLEILHPERELKIAGVSITLREYGFVEGMKLMSEAAPLLEGIKGLMAGDLTGALLDYSALESVFATHIDVVTAMAAQACDQPVAWVRGLKPEAGETLLFTWWAVNGSFFVRRLLRDLAMRMAAPVSAGAKSTPVSRQPVMATPGSSGAAPVVN